MSVKSGQVIASTFRTANPTTGANADATETPTATLFINGEANAATVTVTKPTGTGLYKFSVTLPTLSAGDVCRIEATATVATVAGSATVWDGVADTVRVSEVSASVAMVDATADAILLDTGTDGVVVAAASKTGYSGVATNMVAAAPTADTIAGRILALPLVPLANDAIGQIAANNVTVNPTPVTVNPTPVTVNPTTLDASERANIATAVWAAGGRTLSGFGTLVADIWAAVADSPGVALLLGRVAGPLTITNGKVTVGTNDDKTGYSGTATNMVAAAPTAEQNATATWAHATGSAVASKVANTLRWFTNKRTVTDFEQVLYADDGVTPLYTQTLTDDATTTTRGPAS